MSRYDIAIIGMGCVFPHANSVDQYWKNILSGDTYFTDMPKRLWHLDNFYSADKSLPGKSYTKVGSFVENFEFDFIKYKMPPANLRGLDPTQLMTIVATHQALDDAGLEFRSDQLTDAVGFVGVSGVDAFAHSAAFLKRHTFLKHMKPILKERGVDDATFDRLYEEMTEELDKRGHVWAPSVAAVGAIPSSVSNRIAQIFGIRGMNMTLDAACASSFVAIDAACNALMCGDARIAVAGGADLGVNPPIYIGFSRVDGLSTVGMSNPFDHTADGLVIGEGVGMVVLKRLEDALEDGDHIRSVIRGVGSSSDGAGQAIYAPSAEGRAVALRNALSIAEIEHSDIQYLEAHATSTIVGDANEYDAISMVYGGDRKNNDPLQLGSVKQQIGHLKAAAGVAGLIKTVLAMENETIPHMPRFTQLTPGATLVSSALEVSTKLKPWVPGKDGQRWGAITTSGFGGVNYHAILEQGDSYQRPKPRPAISREIAIVGVSCRVAGAEDVDTFWDNVVNAKDTFTEVTDPAKYDWQNHFETGPQNEIINTHVVSSIEDYDMKLLRHKIFPTAVSQISPTQLLALDLADRLLDDYGLDYAERKKIGVSVGSMHDDYFPTVFYPMLVDEHIDAIKCCAVSKKIDSSILEEALEAAQKSIVDYYPPVTEHTLPGWMTNVTAGRIANKLNLEGPNFTVDSACSSGISAMVPAMYQLMYGKVDMMITGGLNCQLSDTFTSGVCALGAVAKYEARPYDETGEGYLIGEGGVFFLVKRLADAERDGDKIFGVVHAIGGSSEADSKSMIAPTERAMERAIKNALRHTDILPGDIGVAETHGSANELSDIVEAKSIAKVLRPTDVGDPVWITAIKSHIGHIYGGSGAASTLSAMLALKTSTVPGIRHLKNIRSAIKEVSDKALPTKGTQPLSADVQVAGVNSLGLGGANYFAVVTGGDMIASTSKSIPNVQRTVLPAKQTARVGDIGSEDIFICLAEKESDYAAALGRAVSQDPIPSFISEGSLVATKMAVTFQTQKELETKLKNAITMLEGGHGVKPLESQGVFSALTPAEGDESQLAFCFPGQGVHYISMGRHLYEEEPLFRQVLDRVHQLAMAEFDFDLLGHIYGDEDDEQIKKTLGTLIGAQTALFAVEVGVAKVLLAKGITPDVMIGHSFGEISALTVAGVWELDDAYKAVIGRIKAAHIIIDGDGPDLGMMSLICSEEQQKALLAVFGDKVLLTNINAPGRFVLSGEKDSVKKLVNMAESFGAEARLLPIGAAFHSRFMEPAREPFRKALASLPSNPPKFPILSTVTGEYIETENWSSDKIADHLSRQLITQLNLPREINRLVSDGVSHFLEVGPGWSLTKMIGAILENKEYRAAPTLHPKVGDRETFRRASAFLMALGHLESAAERMDVPGVFSPDFLAYMETYEPAVLQLITEVQGRFMAQVRQGIATVPNPVSTPSSVAKRSTGQAPASALQGALAPRPVKVDGVDTWIERLREKLVTTTGYPPEMLEIDLDLEADLGVDSVQRAEIWVSLTTEYGLDQETRPQGTRTIANLARTLAKMAQEAVGDMPAIQEPASTIETPTAESVTGGGDVNVWIERLREKLVTTTGYPPEMLEIDLDLEADLGVDSVQRAEIWVSLTTEYGLDQETRPQGTRTIANLAQTLSKMEVEASGGAKTTEQVIVKAPVSEANLAVDKAELPVTQSTEGDVDIWIERLREKLVTTTGYPPEMLEIDLDLEADLGVDSVQRAEIWVSLTTEHELDADARPQGVRTIANLAGTLAGLAASKGSGVEKEISSNPFQPKATVALDDEAACRLFVAGCDFVSTDMLETFKCKHVLAITGEDDSLIGKLRRRFTKRNIGLSLIKSSALIEMSNEDAAELLNNCDTVLYVAHSQILGSFTVGSVMQEMLKTEIERLYGVFRRMIPALLKHPKRLIFPVSQDGAFGLEGGRDKMLGSFPAGFVRSLDRELEECKLVLLDVGDVDLADAINQVITLLPERLEIGLSSSGLVVPNLCKLTQSDDRRFLLDNGDLVLVTGGARGIVFECVFELARLTGCKLLLTGRTELPKGKPDWLDTQPANIDKVIRTMEINMVKTEGLKLPEAKRIGAKIKSQWEVSRNLQRLEQAGIEVRYEKCDVSNSVAFAQLIDDVSKNKNASKRIRGVIHGSGVQKAKLVTELTDEAIARTMNTKMAPLFVMIDSLNWADIKLFSAFGSIAGLFGNAGQTDYGLANDMLAWAVQEIDAMHPHLHAQIIDWTAWTGTGMVSAEESKRFAEAGLTPLDVPTGIDQFIEGLLGSSFSRLSVFNESAGFATSRSMSAFPVTPRTKRRLVEKGADGAQTRATFSLEKDVYINQHLVNLEPVIPGTFVTEIFAEVLAGEKVVPVDIQFRRPLQLRGDELVVEVVRGDDSMMLLPADRPKLEDRALANLSFATCRLSKETSSNGASLKITKKDLKELREQGDSSGASFYNLLDSKFSNALKTGPVFRGIRATLDKGEYFYSLITITRACSSLIDVPGEFVFNPVLADMAVQVGAAWAMQRHDVMEIPFEIGSMKVGDTSSQRDAVVICKALEINDEKTVIDLAVRDLEGKLILAMDKLVLKTIFRSEE